jgi:alanine racemase
MARPQLHDDDDERGEAAALRVLRPRRAAPADAARVTRAEINLAHVRHNLRELQACMAADAAAGRAPARIWAVLKADAYGHGASAIATTLEQAGVDGLCVALLEEGIELRQAGVTRPILVMGGYYGRRRDALEALIEHRLTPVVYDAEAIEALGRAVRFVRDEHGGGADLGVHLKIDTGMGRLGVRGEGLDAVVQALRQSGVLRVEGLMTHLACADEGSLEATERQLDLFEEATAHVRRAGLEPSIRHAAGSAAMLRLPRAELDAVRPGIALYGVHPCPTRSTQGARPPNLKPVMTVVTEVVAIRDVPAGEAIGYGYTWRASRPSRVATIPMGYADGLSRALSNKGAVLVGGRRAPIVGTVSMDMTMIDVTDIDGAGVRDEVVVLGPQRGRLGEDVVTADEIGERTGTIAYECLTAISRRVPRFYRQP